MRLNAFQGRQPCLLKGEKGNMHLGRYALHQNSFMNKSCFPSEVFMIPHCLLGKSLFLYHDTEMVNREVLKSDLNSLMKDLMFGLIFLFFSSLEKGLLCWRLKSLLSPERNVSKQGITIMNSTVHDTKARSSSLLQAVKDLAISWQFFRMVTIRGFVVSDM